MQLFVTTFHGDLRDDARVYSTLESALADLAARYGEEHREEWDGETYITYDTPDPEDDRVVVWKAEPGEPLRAVWHFSGWHWQHDAGDLPGGPLEQGALPGHERSLYQLAMEDQ